MGTAKKPIITVKVKIDAPIDKVWKCWTSTEDIICWNFASDDWHSPHAENNLHVGGNFSYRMEAKDGTVGFDFEGTYEKIVSCQQIAYVLADDRRVHITFSKDGDNTIVTETFDAENENPVELQRGGWQAILDNFKKHVEST